MRLKFWSLDFIIQYVLLNIKILHQMLWWQYLCFLQLYKFIIANYTEFEYFSEGSNYLVTSFNSRSFSPALVCFMFTVAFIQVEWSRHKQNKWKTHGQLGAEWVGTSFLMFVMITLKSFS